MSILKSISEKQAKDKVKKIYEDMKIKKNKKDTEFLEDNCK